MDNRTIRALDEHITKTPEEYFEVNDFQEKINDYKEQLQRKKGQQEKLKNQLKELENELNKNLECYEDTKEAQSIIQKVAKMTQEQIKIHIEDIVNLALQSIPFPDQYNFGLDFVVKRNRTECELYFEKNGNRIGNPMDSTGSGILDIASFGLRIALWSLKLKKKNNTMIIDEPFKNINDPDNELQLKHYIGEMMKKISQKLNIQFIVIGSNNDFIRIADKIFRVKSKKGISEVKNE